MRVSHHTILWLGGVACLMACSYLLFLKLTDTINVLYTLDKATIRFDPLFSQTFCAQVVSWLEQNGQSSNEHVYRELKKEFSGIVAIDARQRIAGKPTVIVKAACPFMRLNTEWILATDTAIVPQAYFDQEAIGHIPTMNVRNFNEHSTQFAQSARMNTVRAIISDLIDQFDVTWIDETRIWFKDKTVPSWNIVTDVYHIPHDEALKRYQSVIKAMNGKSSRGKKVQSWVADMRFADQIIVYGTKGVENETA